MYRIKTMNKIASAGLDQLDKSRFQVGEDVENEDGILVRSAKMHDYVFPDALRAIARAGAGTNNIPIDRCSESGIVVFNTPGANANAVKELVIAALLIASRDIVGGVDWVQEQAHTPNVDVAAAVEKGKSAFVGPELYRKTLGVIGLGAIGALVCNIGLDLGMDVYGYDPYLSVDAALRLDRHVHVVKDINDLYKRADYVTLHIHYTGKTAHMIDADAIAAMDEDLTQAYDQINDLSEELEDLEADLYEDDEDDEEPEEEEEDTEEDDNDDDIASEPFYEVACPNCGETVYVSEDDLDAGEANCAHCGVTFEVALEDEDEEQEEGPVKYEVTCPACGQTTVFEEDDLLDGAPKCPGCGKPLDFEVTEE